MISRWTVDLDATPLRRFMPLLQLKLHRSFFLTILFQADFHWVKMCFYRGSEQSLKQCGTAQNSMLATLKAATMIHWFDSHGLVALQSQTALRASDQIAPTLWCVLRRKLPCSTVNEEGGLKKQSGRTPSRSARLSFSAPTWWRTCFHLSRLRNSQDACFLKSGGKSRVSLCGLASTVGCCYFKIC